MSDFDPGPGWREVTEREWLSTPIDADHLELASNGKIRHWVREVPVPALPTAPYTVIRVTWRDDQRDPDEYALMVGTGTGKWAYLLTDAGTFSSDVLATLITSFEVLSEPRAVTAKAVLDHIWNENGGPVNGYVDLAKHYGVES
jgi:hypothetical protein